MKVPDLMGQWMQEITDRVAVNNFAEEENMGYEHEWADDIARLCEEYGVFTMRGGVCKPGVVRELKRAIEDRVADLIRRSVPDGPVDVTLGEEKLEVDQIYGGVWDGGGTRCCDECADILSTTFIDSQGKKYCSTECQRKAVRRRKTTLGERMEEDRK